MNRVFTPSEFRGDIADGIRSGVSTRVLPIIGTVLSIALFAWLAAGSILANSPTIDEPIHLLAGYSYVKWGDYRVNPEHPPLAKVLAALPLLALDIKDPRLSSPDWNDIPRRRPGIPAARVALQMFFADNDAETLFFYAKLPFVLLGATLALFVFLWSEEDFGIIAALAALLLFVTNPTVLAHSTVIHTDIAFSLCFFAATYFFQRSLRKNRRSDFMAACSAFALATVTKFSAIGIFISWVIIGLFWCMQDETSANGDASQRNSPFPLPFVKRETGGVKRAGAAQKPIFLATLLFTGVAMAFVMIWAAYGFRFAAVPDGVTGFSFNTIWNPGAPRLVKDAVLFALRYHLLPEAWIYGQLYNLAFIHRGSYLLGSLSADGFLSYFPVALAVKTPIPALALIALGFFDVLRRGAWKKLQCYSLWIPVAVYFGLAVAARMNIGVRHILPIFPFLFVLGGAGAARLLGSRARWKKYSVICLFVWGGWNLVSTYPNYFAFFNGVGGRSKGGHPILLDSNLDWGQDLKRLKSWLDEHGVKKTLLLYFGMAEPAYYGIDAVQLPGSVFPARLALARRSGDLPYTLAVSANHFYAASIYSMPLEQDFLESFHLARPDAVVGDSILIFKLDPSDAQVNLNLGRILALNGETSLAEVALRKILPTSPLAAAAGDLLADLQPR